MNQISALIWVLLFILASIEVIAQSSACCERNDPTCWPTSVDLTHLQNSLDPTIPRSLLWNGDPNPYPSGIPIYSPDDQPLYGAGKTLAPLYIQSDQDINGSCFIDKNTQQCLIATRNNPMFNYEPAFIVWPTNITQVQTIIQFANDHNLCTCVVGTGHDFVNRHSCNQGILIRTSLFKDKIYNSDTKTAKFGSGNTFNEIHAWSHNLNLTVASGWSKTVGIAGWTLGGGHGPIAHKLGLGVDQLIEAEIVIANGSLAITNSAGTQFISPSGISTYTPNTDLYWAIRGGGGSTWGVLTSFTVKVYPTPPQGFTIAVAYAVGDFCQVNGREQLNNALHQYVDWSLNIDDNWSGITDITQSVNESNPNCTINWMIQAIYVYYGPPTDSAFISTWQSLISDSNIWIFTFNQSFQDLWALNQLLDLEYIYPIATMEPQDKYPGSVLSVLINRDLISGGAFWTEMMTRFDECENSKICLSQRIHHDLTGKNIVYNDTAINPGMRTGVYHLAALNAMDLSAYDFTEEYYNLGDYAYLNECAYNMPDWHTRLWGDSNYKRLSSIKQNLDNRNRFGCHHCIGDTSV